MVVCQGSICGVDRAAAIDDVTDGMSRTILVVETSRAPCPWTSPEAVVDLSRGINLPSALSQGASSNHPGGAFALFAGGEVRFLSDKIDTTTLRALCTMAGGETVDDGEF